VTGWGTMLICGIVLRCVEPLKPISTVDLAPCSICTALVTYKTCSRQFFLLQISHHVLNKYPILYSPNIPSCTHQISHLVLTKYPILYSPNIPSCTHQISHHVLTNFHFLKMIPEYVVRITKI